MKWIGEEGGVIVERKGMKWWKGRRSGHKPKAVIGNIRNMENLLTRGATLRGPTAHCKTVKQEARNKVK